MSEVPPPPDSSGRRATDAHGLIHRLARADSPLFVFLGAGASRGLPSAVPIAGELAPLIIRAIAERADAPRNFADNLVAALADAQTTLEHFAYIGVKTFGSDFLTALSVASSATGRINDFHLGLAHAARAGSVRAIITTNFDEYLEAALRTLGVEPAPACRPPHKTACERRTGIAFYRVLASTDDFQRVVADPDAAARLTTTRHLGDTLPIVKLHGTVSNPESLRATIEDYQSWFLRPQKDLFEYPSVLGSADCLFVGYSAADEVFPWFHSLGSIGLHCWLDLPGVSYVRHLAKTTYHIVPDIPMPAEEFGRALLAEFAAAPVSQISAMSADHALSSALAAWARQRPAMQCFNFLARTALRLGRYADALHLVRIGFQSTSWNARTERASIVYGLMLISMAKTELGDTDHGVADIDRAISDWTQWKDEFTSGGLDESTWEYAKAEMSLARAWAYHLLDRHVFDQVLAWEEMKTAWALFSAWHDLHFKTRNFESSPEFAELNWRMGLFALRGRDLAYARSCFYRIIDVDVFNVRQMMRAKHLFGLALMHEAASADQASELEPAFRLAEEALNYATAEHHPALIADLLLCLGRLTEQRNLPLALTYFRRAAERLETWNGDRTRAQQIRARLHGERP